MPPRRYSRYQFCEGVKDEAGRLYLTDRVPFRYRPLSDSRSLEVGDGDDLFTLAGRCFPSFPEPNSLWFVIADFQPDPIIDPTIRFSPGTVIIVPSERVVREQIFSEDRRDDLDGE